MSTVIPVSLDREDELSLPIAYHPLYDMDWAPQADDAE